MRNKIKLLVLGAFMALGLIALPLTASTVTYAANREEVCKGIDSIDSNATADCTNKEGGQLSGFIKKIINILLFIIGAIAVLMIIIGGLRYVLSAGDQSAVTGAKNTILYAVVGLIIAVMAFAIVNFVLSSF